MAQMGGAINPPEDARKLRESFGRGLLDNVPRRCRTAHALLESSSRKTLFREAPC